MLLLRDDAETNFAPPPSNAKCVQTQGSPCFQLNIEHPHRQKNCFCTIKAGVTYYYNSSPSLELVSVSRRHRHHGGNWNYSAYCHYCVLTRVPSAKRPSAFNRSYMVENNRHYSTAAMEKRWIRSNVSSPYSTVSRVVLR